MNQPASLNLTIRRARKTLARIDGTLDQYAMTLRQARETLVSIAAGTPAGGEEEELLVSRALNFAVLLLDRQALEVGIEEGMASVDADPAQE